MKQLGGITINKEGNMIRTAKKSDERALRLIWQEAFEDEIEYEDLAWSRFDALSRLTVATDDEDIPVSLACLYDSGGLQKDGETSRFPCIYGVGTRKESRGHGYAMEAIDELLTWCRQQKISSVMIAPAEESLFGLYRRRFGFEPYFTVAEMQIDIHSDHPNEIPSKSDVPQAGEKKLTPVSAKQYGKMREEFLKHYAKEQNIPYVTMSEEQLLYEQELLNLADGSFFCESFEGPKDGMLLGAYEQTEDGLFFPELLIPPGKTEQIMSRIRPYSGGKNARAYLPEFVVTDAAESPCISIRAYAMRLCLDEGREDGNEDNHENNHDGSDFETGIADEEITGRNHAYAGFIFD
jgi:GNAT superfamily N-acetyltransferase